MIIHDAQEAVSYPTGSAELWSRIFHHIRWRWPARVVTWIVEADCIFVSPLKPATVTALDIWAKHAREWQNVGLLDAPVGIDLPQPGLYRVTADVGGATVPDDVQAAYQRLSDYMTSLSDAGATRISDGDFTIQRTSLAASNAMILSGAADLLRPYR